LGSNTDDFRAHQQVVYQLARYPNVFADTSAVRQFDYIVEAVKRAGPRKLLFGSDGPWLHPGVEIAKIRLLGLSAENEALILGGNILRLLHVAGADVTRRSLDTFRSATRHAGRLSSDRGRV
jgi:predicted TIM-barrel fold metal-dependent hydrolase